MIDGVTLPTPGEGRFWLIKHEPRKVKVLRIELRQTLSECQNPHPSLSSLLGWTNAHATDDDVKKACEQLKLQASRALDFLGVHA